MSHSCRLCGHDHTLETLVDLGLQPVSTRFVPATDPAPRRFPLALMQCPCCGLIQLAAAFPTDALRPLRPMVYREPESHLDQLVEDLVLPCDGLNIWGMTVKDDTLLARLERLGAKTWTPAPMDWGVSHPLANIETLQAEIDPARMSRLVDQHGQTDRLVMRHILEHCHDPLTLLAAARLALAPGGTVVIEVPDCRKSLELCDYSMIWEEHVTYFTPPSLTQLLHRAGYQVIEQRIYPCPYEDLIVVVARPGQTDARVEPVDLSLGQNYARQFPYWSAKLRQILGQAKTQGRELLLFGAGHLTAAFVNYHDLTDLFEGVIDDTDWKQGCCLPGTTLPILGSHHLIDRPKAWCLTGVGPNSEAGIQARNQGFLEKGGRFLSILADSPSSLRLAHVHDLLD